MISSSKLESIFLEAYQACRSSLASISSCARDAAVVKRTRGAFLASGQAQSQGDVGFPACRVSQRQDVFSPFDELANGPDPAPAPYLRMGSPGSRRCPALLTTIELSLVDATFGGAPFAVQQF